MTDEVYEHLVFEGEHVPLAELRRHARPHGHHLVGRQDLLGDRLEDRLGVREPAARSARCRPPSSSSPSRAARRSSTRWRPGWPSPDARIAAVVRRPDERRRDLFCDGLADVGFEVSSPQSGYFALTDIAATSGRHDAAALLRRGCRSAAAWSAIPTHVFFDDKVDRPRPRPVGVLQVDGHPRRGPAPAGERSAGTDRASARRRLRS